MTVRVLGTALLILCLPGWPGHARSKPIKRFFVMGDGTIKIRSKKNRFRFAGRFRHERGWYKRSPLRKINRVFDANYDKLSERVSLRLIELLSYVRQEMKGGWITLSSGYRSPDYNASLMARGMIAAKASLHQFGMAADLSIEGVDSKKAWRLVRKRRLGGAGYYGNPWIHIDVGPPRSWTETTANVRKGKTHYNKLIMPVTDYDIYRPGERMTIRFVRMTAYPVGVRSRAFALERRQKGAWRKVLSFFPSYTRLPMRKHTDERACQMLSSVEEMAGIRWTIPRDMEPGRYRIRARLCKGRWSFMPDQTRSFQFQIVKRRGPT